VSMVGKNIDAFCSRCGLTLAHICLYEVGGAVRGVKCKTCGVEHLYRGPKPQKKRDVAEERRSRIGGAAWPARPAVRPIDARQWELKNAAVAPDVVIWDYRLTERYEKGDVIAHPQFGRGFVLAVTGERMEVLFREGRKHLAMNHPAASPEESGA
jgi:hypothetical protein